MKSIRVGDGELSYLRVWMLYFCFFTIFFPHSITGLGDYDRIGSSACSVKDIVIEQGPGSPLWSGIPTYNVQLFNVCLSDGECNIGDIHVSCGWFSSAILVDPSIFRRLSYNDCLVNNGDPIHAGQMIIFQYANSFSYPLSISSVACF